MNTKIKRSQRLEDLAIKISWFISGTVVGLMFLSIGKAAVPKKLKMVVTDDTALYQNLSEIQVQKKPELRFDSEIEGLSKSEAKFREKLPLKKTTSVARNKRIKTRR